MSAYEALPKGDGTVSPSYADDRIPLFMLATILIRNRVRIATWAFAGGVIALGPVINKQLTYRGSVTFVPSGYNAGQAGIAGLAGQFGLSIGAPSGGGAQSPEFYMRLAKSRVVLAPIIRDSFEVDELGNKRLPLMVLLKVPAGNAEEREERGIEMLAGAITPSFNRPTGVVEIGVESPYRSLSLGLTERLVQGINDYNQRVRLSAAVQERRHVEARLLIASRELQDAEERLDTFTKSNRIIAGSPDLQTKRDRIQRNLSLKQSIYTSLATSLEDVRVREARDMPVISIVEPPMVPTKPQPRGRFSRLLFGLLLGTLLGALATFAKAFMVSRHEARDADAADFEAAVRGVRDEILRPVQWLRRW